MDKNNQATVSRRDFLKLTGVGLSGALLQPASTASASAPGKDDVAILFDASKCIGCRACERACTEYNNLPTEPELHSELSATTWNFIGQREGVDQDHWPFFNYQCMHCTNAACTIVCPTRALHKDEMGFVAFDQDKCIGCGYCTQFCPYGVPHLRDVNLLTGAARATKCTFCQAKVSAGEGGPSCAEACPTGALTWGKRETLLKEAKSRVSELKTGDYSKATLYGETEAGGLHRLSILLDEPSAYDLPVDPQGPITLANICKKFVPPVGLAAFGAAGLGIATAFLLARHNIHMEEEE